MQYILPTVVREKGSVFGSLSLKQPKVPQGKALVLLLSGTPPDLAINVSKEEDYKHILNLLRGHDRTWTSKHIYLIDEDVALSNLDKRVQG